MVESNIVSTLSVSVKIQGHQQLQAGEPLKTEHALAGCFWYCLADTASKETCNQRPVPHSGALSASMWTHPPPGMATRWFGWLGSTNHAGPNHCPSVGAKHPWCVSLRHWDWGDHFQPSQAVLAPSLHEYTCQDFKFVFFIHNQSHVWSKNVCNQKKLKNRKECLMLWVLAEYNFNLNPPNRPLNW